jgi:ketosteroid isomerase-like protein
MIKKLLKGLFIIFMFSCNSSGEKKVEKAPSYDATINDKYDLMDADEDFSDLSKEKGMKKAFMEYIDSNGVLLRPNEHPLVGADAIDYLSQLNDTTYTLEWKPENAIVAKSGELGFTYGYYKLTPNGKDTILYGTYVSIWKKQSDGRWKYLLDTGNDGVGSDELPVITDN